MSIEEPEAKKMKMLKSTENDLKVILGGGRSIKDGDDNNNNDTKNEQSHVRWYPRVLLASYSNFVDTMLTTTMQESQQMELRLPEINVETWDAAIRFMDTSEGRKMTAQDVAQVALLYDQYDFTQGRALCDQVALEYFENLKQQELDLTLDVDLLIDVVSVAQRANLNKAYQVGIKYIQNKMHIDSVPYGQTMFSESHLKKLKPVILHDMAERENSGRRHIWHIEKEAVQSPSFATETLLRFQNTAAANFLFDLALSHITLTGSTCSADGDYKWDGVVEFETDDREGRWNGEIIYFYIKKKDGVGNWIVLGRIFGSGDDGGSSNGAVKELVLWESPYSQSLVLPPRCHWKPVDPLARGNLSIEYHFRGGD